MKIFKHTFVLWCSDDPPGLSKDFAAFAEGSCGRGYRIRVEEMDRKQAKDDPDAEEDVLEMFGEGVD